MITSSSSGEDAEFITQGAISFSNFFWNHIFSGEDIRDSFEMASESMSRYQYPLLDGNSNGESNENEDYDTVRNLFIGAGVEISQNAPVTDELRRKAILVAGSSQSDKLWPAVENCIKSAYNALHSQGYRDDDIYLMTPSGVSVPGITAISRTSEKTNIFDALERWAVHNTQDILLYLVGNGENGYFQLNDSETLQPDELDVPLDITDFR